MYYPKSQIKLNLYTNGGEYLLSTTKQPYKGKYYEVSNGDKYTGNSPQDSSNILLIIKPILPDPLFGFDEGEGETLSTNINGELGLPIISQPTYNNNQPQIRFLPPPNITQPTQQDYDLGVFMRYFTKKNNENIYLEINKETYTLLQSQDPKMAWELYTPLSISWELVGEQDKVFLTNKNIVSIAEQRNKWYGFTQWFKDNFLKYHQNLASQENLYTSGKEFKTPNGREYIGPYHIHPQNGAMVGATHMKKKHDSLTPINSTILSPQSSSQPPPNISFSPSTGGGGY